MFSMYWAAGLFVIVGIFYCITGAMIHPLFYILSILLLVLCDATELFRFYAKFRKGGLK